VPLSPLRTPTCKSSRPSRRPPCTRRRSLDRGAWPRSSAPPTRCATPTTTGAQDRHVTVGRTGRAPVNRLPRFHAARRPNASHTDSGMGGRCCPSMTQAAPSKIEPTRARTYTSSSATPARCPAGTKKWNLSRCVVIHSFTLLAFRLSTASHGHITRYRSKLPASVDRADEGL
jgi:hypothetical protein